MLLLKEMFFHSFFFADTATKDLLLPSPPTALWYSMSNSRTSTEVVFVKSNLALFLCLQIPRQKSIFLSICEIVFTFDGTLAHQSEVEIEVDNSCVIKYFKLLPSVDIDVWIRWFFFVNICSFQGLVFLGCPFRPAFSKRPLVFVCFFFLDNIL